MPVRTRSRSYAGCGTPGALSGSVDTRSDGTDEGYVAGSLAGGSPKTVSRRLSRPQRAQARSVVARERSTLASTSDTATQRR